MQRAEISDRMRGKITLSSFFMSEIPEISRENEQDARGALADRIRKEAINGRKDLLSKTLTGRKVTVVLPRDQQT